MACPKGTILTYTSIGDLDMASCNDKPKKNNQSNPYKETQPIKKPRPETKSEAIRRIQGE